MMSKNPKLFNDAEEKIDYEKLIKKYPWIIEKNQKCVISPDADGMLCGLFMSHYLNWEIVGYYDNGKNLILRNGISAKECVFLDTEIYRKEIRSCGHHIVLYRNNDLPHNWDNFSNCLNPNNLRGRSLKNQFSLKYPMGTIHLLICIVGYRHDIKFSRGSLFAVLQADGTINRFIDRYSENLIDWLNYLNVFEGSNFLSDLLHHEVDFLDFSRQYVDYVQRFVKTQKDKIPISDSNDLKIESFNNLLTGFSDNCIKQIQEYLSFLSKNTGWNFKEDKWLQQGFKLLRFTKRVVKPGVRTYEQAVKEIFLSLAFTKSDRLEYTIEKPDKLFS